MTSCLHFIFFSHLFISIFLSTAKTTDSPNALILPVMKDGGTLQYVTYIDQGTPPVPLKLVVDLGGSLLWTVCESRYASFSSYKPARCRSIQCSTANANECGRGTDFNSTCGLLTTNSITGTSMNGELGEDIIAPVDNFLLSCARTPLLQGLPRGVKGMVGLGQSRISLPAQLTRVNNKFSICLPSSTSSEGMIFFDTNPHIREVRTSQIAEVSKSLTYTPLIPTKNSSHKYYIEVKSIKINGRQLSINEDSISGAQISAVVPYTTLETSIYKTFSRAFTEVGTLLFNMTRVSSVAPFEVCFSSKEIANARAGPVVPIIDLVLQSNMVKWRIHGINSMVQVSDEVTCLGFLDGGLNTKDSIVIGGYQLENNLLEFDLAGSRMGFTSLLEKGIECSNFIKLHEQS